MFKFIRRLIIALLAIVLIAVAIPVLGLAYGFMTTDTVVLDQPAELADGRMSTQLAGEINGYKRPEESTFLTYPEWAIVYAAREYAGFVENRFPSAFPYWAYIGRFWQDYALMIRATSPYPFNFENHLMLMVIGVSHTVEHAVQWGYENTIGRLTELAGGWEPVPEDDYQAHSAAEYAAFLDQVPWYEFAYDEKRAGLWKLEAGSGMPAIRSWERKLGFGAAYSIKQGYAALIKSGLDATSDAALLDIYVWAQGPVEQAIAGEPDTELVRDLGPDGAVFVAKRYQVFTEMVPRLIEKGVRFMEIGGNRMIFITALSKARFGPVDGAQILFDYALPSASDTFRAGFVVPVAKLHTVLPAIMKGEASLEHIYDY